MSDFITLSCPTCGHRLQITDDIERFACSACGNEHVVRRAGGTVSIAPVVEGLGKVQASTDRVAAELALQRLNAEVQQAQQRLTYATWKAKVATGREGQIAHTKTYVTLSIIFGLWTLAGGAGITFIGPQNGATSVLICIVIISVMVAIFAMMSVIRDVAFGPMFKRWRVEADATLLQEQQNLSKLIEERDHNIQAAKG
jgi:hypothetical protein